MNVLIRLILLFFLFLTSQSGIAAMNTFTEHQYDVNHITLGEEIYGYDTTSNHRYCYLAPLAEKTQDRTFLAFASDFIVTKGLGKVDPNKLNHVFGQEKHKLGPLLDKFSGNQEKAFRALDDAAQQAFKGGKLNLKNGINTQTRVNVNGVK